MGRCSSGVLFADHVTLHSSTKIPPANLMFHRRIHYSLPDATNKLNHIDLEEKLEFNDQNLHSTHTHIVSLLKKV